MLLNLHVKNLALIKEVDVDFSNGLVVLTGETGAGKSLILGSVNIALGNKVEKELIRNGAEFALVELTFQIDSITKEKLEAYDIFPEDENIITVSRKITSGRSVSKINGETVNIQTLKSVMSLLIDIHGQHDHQSLLYKNQHLLILDKFASEEGAAIKNQVNEKYQEYVALTKKIDAYDMDENQRMRECEFAEFEIHEIESANLRENEDVQLEEEYKKLSNGENIMSGLSKIYQILGYDNSEGIGECINRATYEISNIASFDDQLEEFQKQLLDIDEMCKDLFREIAGYIDEVNYEPERVRELESRLDLLNHLKLKYGQSIEEILAYQSEKQEYLEKIQNYSLELEQLQNERTNCYEQLEQLCEQLSMIRKKAAKQLEILVTKALEELNFLTVSFQIEISKKESIHADGYDEVEFMISTNPGEPVKPLAKVASGGELSRIMLAIKSILASEDEIDTLIFDEIDTGISGKTAQMVAEKLMTISNRHQIICISHLAQIAAMADSHYLIEKSVEEQLTKTEIKKLSREESIKELVRISSGGEITEAALKHATEMKEMAESAKLGQC